MRPTHHEHRLFDRITLDPPPAARLSFDVHGLLRNRTKSIEVQLIDLSLDGAALGVGEWNPSGARDLRVHFGSVSSGIEIRSSSSTQAGRRIHVRFHRPPPAFTARIRDFIEHASRADATNWATVKQTWTGS